MVMSRAVGESAPRWMDDASLVMASLDSPTLKLLAARMQTDWENTNLVDGVKSLQSLVADERRESESRTSCALRVD